MPNYKSSNRAAWLSLNLMKEVWRVYLCPLLGENLERFCLRKWGKVPSQKLVAVEKGEEGEEGEEEEEKEEKEEGVEAEKEEEGKKKGNGM